MSNNQTHTKFFKYSTIIATLFIWLFIMPSQVFAQTPQLILDVNIVDPTSGPLETGQIVEYVIDFSCASVLGPCGDLNIDFPLDTELELIEVIAPPGYIGSFTGTPPNITVHVINDPVSNAVFEDGEAAQVTVRARVSQDIDDTSIETTVTGDVSNGGGATTVTTAPDVPVSSPAGGWDVAKSTTSPSGGLGPAIDGEASYIIEVCPTTTLGVAQLTELVFSDRFPIGATVQSSTPASFVLEDQLPAGTPDGTDDTIVWTIDLSPVHTVEDGCVNVSYTLAFPSPPFTAGSDITNAAFVSATTASGSDPFTNDGDCPTCVGRSTNPGTIDNPSVTGNGTKTGPGTTIVSPGISSGTSTFNITWDLAQSNVSGTGFTVTDTFPLANSDSLPITEISQITTATWADGYQALLQITTVGNPAWTTIDTVDGSTASVYTEGVDLPALPLASTDDLITGIRWQFIEDVPPGFAADDAAIIRFFVRDGMDPVQDYGSPTFEDYDNCIDLTGTYLDEFGAPQPIISSQDCANLRISDDNTTGITNIITSKSRDKTAVFPLEAIQFTLNVGITQEASGDLLNPAIQDILPFGMQITSWDDVSFSASIPGGEQILPHLRVDDVLVGGERRQRLLFYWDNTVTGSDVETLPSPPVSPNYAPSYTPTSYTCTNPANCQDPISSPSFANNYDYSTIAGTPPVAGNPLTMTPPNTGIKTITIRFTAQPRLDSVAGDDAGNLIPSTNTTTVITDSAVVSCQSGTASTEQGSDDIDDDGIFNEVVCETGTSFQIREAAQMSSQKWIRDTAIIPNLGFVNSQNLNDPSPACPTFTYSPASAGGPVQYTRFPCVAQGASGGSFEYLMRIQNTGLVNTVDYILYDVLPHEGDTGVSEALAGDARLTEFVTYLTGPIVAEAVPSGFLFDVEYNTDPLYNSCRPEMSSDATESPANHWQPGCNNTWVDAATIGGAWNTVTSFRIVQRQPGGVIPSGDEMIFTAPMVIDGTPGEAETGEIAWNTFAQRFDNQPSGRRLLTAEPRKVGIIVEEVFSIGNRVWIDDGIGGGIADNGRIDGTEIGVNGITVELYLTSNLATPYATDVTRQDTSSGLDGYYFFGNLPAGQYRVVVVGNEFDTGQELNGYISSTGNQNTNTNPGAANNLDSIDTGQDQANPAAYIANGVRTNNFNLSRNNEATGETDVNDDNAGTDPSPPTNEGLLGRGENFEQDVDSDLTVDFGFFRPMSIGNRIWLDNGADSGDPTGFNAAQYNDGILNGDEVGINGVTVLLYHDSNRDGVVNGSDTPLSTTTASGGYYLFDGLPPGEYRVEIPVSNFTGPLTGLQSSYDVSAPVDADPDNDDHGIDVAVPVGTPVSSPTIILSPLGEVTIEDDEAVTGLGTNGEIDENSDLTVDFGFVEVMSIGNRVWFDTGEDTGAPSGYVPSQLNDGILNGTEIGVSGVTVNLYRASDLLTPISTTTTDGTGYYLFDNLLRGDYVVTIPAANFGAGQPLEGYLSSTDVVAPADADADNDDHGIDVTPPILTAINSPVITLTPGGEAQVDDEAVTGTANNPPPNIADNNSDLTVDFGFYKSMSLGNRVWLDNGVSGATTILSQFNDGILNGTEAGIDGVTVNLYLTTDLTTSIASTTTANGGYYLFDGLVPSSYIVEIPALNFSGPLANLQSSFDAVAPVDADADNDDHGIDVAVPVTDPVRSPVIVLTHEGEVVAEDSEDVTGTGQFFETDDNSDLTVDFGFVAVMSLGNRVWMDDGAVAGGFNPAQFDDGILNGTESGIPGAVVNLYFASDLGTVIATTSTDGTGYYLFENLPPGDYVVEIPAVEFTTGQPLEGYFSSTDVVAPGDGDADNDDHGINPAIPGTDPVLSPTITLTPGGENQADDEAVTGTDGGTAPFIADNNSDLTVDFGFFRPMSIGNRIWLDIDNVTAGSVLGDGIRQTAEAALGVGGVTVELYADDGAGGLGALIASTTTTGAAGVTGANNGYYLFDRQGADQTDPNARRIGPGNYIVHIPASNFAAAAPLFNFINSDGANASGGDVPIDSILDSGDENGINATPGVTATYPVNAGVSSTTITLAYDTESTTEGDFDPAQAASYNGEGVEDDNGNLTVDFGFYQGLAIGNRVWFDGDRDGLIDANDNPFTPGNPGIAGVTVHLYSASDLNTIIATDVTDSEGYYIFDRLTSGGLILPGDYVVGIPSAGVNSVVLADHVSTITLVGGTLNDSPTDNDDNGIDRRDLGSIPTIIYSETINLTHLEETTTEADTDKETGVGDGRGVQDINSNLTVDFGFIIPMSIGNQVWLDINNDALINNGEVGLNGVLVELFRDTGAGIDPLNDTPYRTTTTNTNGGTTEGYYIFDDLPEGNYIVRLAPENFIPIAGGGNGSLVDAADAPYSSSESGGATEATYLLDNQTDDNDNGIDENFPQTNGISSNIINLTYYQEPDGTPAADDTNLDLDGSAGASGEGTFGERDDNGEMTIDFGVYPPLMSIGNRIFKDYDNNRILDGADVGVNGVVVNLFMDSNQDGIPDSGINNPIATTTTADGGYYIFDGLMAGFYLVQVDENNFRTIGTGGNGILLNYYSSQDKDGSNTYVRPVDGDLVDSIDNGIDTPFNLGNNPNLQAAGIFSPTIELVPSSEWALEPDLGPAGDGEPNIQASNSDLTVDFGFYQPMSIGNHVWFDTNEDGLFNGLESAITGVQVQLYRQTDGDASTLDITTDTLVQLYDGTSYINFDTTNANGFYLFDNLPAGQYWVHIPATEFASGRPLFNHVSTIDNTPNPTIAPAPASDRNDNGTPNDTTNVTEGVTSELITLGVIDPVNGSGLYIPNGSEPVNEVHKSNTPPTPANTYDGPASIGRYGELDNNSDITIDFGFTLADEASMSIGNRVWFDTNRNGLIDDAGDDNPLAPGNPGIDNVTVLLYRANAGGLPVGNPIARDITANGGYYLFDVLDTDALTAIGDGDGLGGPITPGNYVVALPNTNFAGGAPLATYISTNTGIDNDGTLPPSTAVEAGYGALDDDNNDNGTLNATYGILSNLVTLVLQNERADEDAANKEAGVLDGQDSTATPIAFNNSDLTIDFGFFLPMSIGNFVWVDTNNNGLYESATESPVDNGVIMALYEADGTTPVDDPANPGTPYQVTTTNGFYLFEGLPPGDYVVRVDLLNFLPGGLLEGYLGSDNSGAGFQDNTDGDLNDNGLDIDPTVSGIPSGVITLDYTTEPVTEATSGNPIHGPNGRGNNGELDNNSNLTVDFGVYPSTYFSIGNRIWVDMGAGANENNGIHDSDELGIQNVIVNLFRDENDGAGGPPDGIPDSTTPFATTTTDANGYYLFDELASGNYIVSVSPDNFEASGALRGYSPAPEPPADTGESAVDHASDQISNTLDPDFGFYSASYTLSLATPEPTGETDATPANLPQEPGFDPFGTPIPDDQSNLTVDFGFVRTMTLGNLVWFDIDNDGRLDAGEVGIPDVTVEIYLDDGATPGVFDGTDSLVDTEITDGNGFYLFENLDPGDYFVHIPNSPNWTSGTGPLEGFQSSGPDATSSDQTDNNDNGLGTGDTNPATGITSELLTLAFGTAPTGEATLSNNPADGPEFRGVNNPPDNNSDLTWDFGFYLGTPMSIGNIVWIDDGNTTGTPNNGIRDGDELGVNGVIVELYADSDGDGDPDTGTPIDTVTTAGGGYYLFDGLPPGQYVVVIAEDNFITGGVLNGYLSTSDGTTPDIDDNDNGVDNPTPVVDGIRSGTIILAVGTEPTADSELVTGTGSNGETDDNSNLTVDFGFIAAYDWGDAPDSYGTDNDTGTTTIPTGFSDQVGPSHRIVANLYLGAFVDDETSGVPVPDGTSNNTNDPDGDGADGGFDEDGMDVPAFVAGTTVTVDITAFNQTGDDATLVAWFDWNGDGVFDASEGYIVSVPDGTDGIVQLDVAVPVDAEDLTGGNTYARLRLTTDTITTSDFIGPMNSGEVEDYYIEVRDPGLLINKTDGLNSIVAGEVNTYTIVIENSGDERTGVTFYDDIPLATDTDANGYDPETIEWTCVAENGASCIAGDPPGTGSAGGPYAANATSVIIDELIDLPSDSRIIYTITARVNEDAGLVPPGNINPIVNVAQLPNEVPPLEDEDITNVIFDPPFGVKTGTYLGNNIIRWTMTWYNPGATQTGVTITDQLASNQVFPPTTAEIDLRCTGSTGTCSIVGDDVVRWQGTMLTSTPADDGNAVVISFNVLVSGDGRYSNTATLNYGAEEETASARVTIEGDEEDEDDSGPDIGGGFSQSAPTLVKTVDTPFTLPGATVVWTITAVNDTDQTVNNVSITDNVPAQLSILNGSSSSGDFTIDGQTVTVKQESFAPGETITITLTTEINSDVAVPFAINNPAVLRCDCSDESNAIATIISVLQLPATGETPWWRLPLLLLILVGGMSVPLLIGYRHKTKNES